MRRCRNCGASDLQDLGFRGRVAPFFLKRVFGMRLGAAESVSAGKRMAQTLAALPQALLDRIRKPAAFVELQLCRTCSFIQTAIPFDEQAINRLYLDYRAESYNRERGEYEPSYKAIAAEVGQDAQEIEVRVSAATKFLLAHMPVSEGFTVLDFGGADGKFLPRIEAEKFVFEISNIEPIAGVTRLHTEEEMTMYSLVQLTHVIEHVVEPLRLVTHVAERVAPGGYLYLETPQELTDEQRDALKAGTMRGSMTIHEHINSYCEPAVARLLESAGMQMVAMESSPVETSWAKAVHIRALGRKA